MTEGDMVNIGTPEKPVLVPEKSLHPESAEGREWWGMITDGSVVLEPEVLDRLLEKTGNEGS